jgi:hypothetical protein
MKKIIGIFFLIMLLAGCWFKDPYIGMYIRDRSNMCRISAEKCEVRTESFNFNLRVERGEGPGEYIVNGSAEPVNAAATWNRIYTGNFDLYLIRDGLVLDHVPFLLTGDYKDKENVRIEFTTNADFNMLGFTWNLRVSD